MKGKLVALEGIDNVGKSSHIDRLERRLTANQIEVVTTKELTTKVGSVVWDYLRTGDFSSHMKALLFAADRVERVEKQVMPAINAGRLVIADRWALSAMVYRFVEGFDTEYVSAVNSLTLQPDLTFLLDISGAMSIQRRNLTQKPEAYSEDFLNRARNHYLELAKGDPKVIVIDGSQPFMNINDQLYERIVGLLGGG